MPHTSTLSRTDSQSVVTPARIRIDPLEESAFRPMSPEHRIRGRGTTNPLAKAINELFRLQEGDLQKVASENVPRIIRIGQKLLEVRKTLPHGKWNGWVEDNLVFSVRTAARYMKLTRRGPNRTRVSDLAACTSILQAYQLTGVVKKPTGKPPFQLFSKQGMAVLECPVANISEDEKEILLLESERLELLTSRFSGSESVLNGQWSKKVKVPPARWTTAEMHLFCSEVKRLNDIRLEVEEGTQIQSTSLNSSKAKGSQKSVKMRPSQKKIACSRHETANMGGIADLFDQMKYGERSIKSRTVQTVKRCIEGLSRELLISEAQAIAELETRVREVVELCETEVQRGKSRTNLKGAKDFFRLVQTGCLSVGKYFS